MATTIAPYRPNLELQRHDDTPADPAHEKMATPETDPDSLRRFDDLMTRAGLLDRAAALTGFLSRLTGVATGVEHGSGLTPELGPPGTADASAPDRGGIDTILGDGPALGGDAVPFSEDLFLPGLAAATSRAGALRAALAEAGLSASDLAGLFGQEADTPDLPGLGGGSNSLAGLPSFQIPGLEGGQDLRNYDRNATKGADSGSKAGFGPKPAEKPTDTVYNKGGIKVTAHETDDGLKMWVQREAGTEPMKGKTNDDGSITVTVKDKDGNTVTATKTKTGVNVKNSKGEEENYIALKAPKPEKKTEEKSETKPANDPKERPVDDDGGRGAEVTTDFLRRWEAKRGGAVDPAGPDDGAEVDVARLAAGIVAWKQSTVNPNPENDGSGGEPTGSAGRNPGEGVVDPVNPWDGAPLPRTTKGPKPDVGPGGPMPNRIW